MPDLPKITVNQTNYDRLLAAVPGETPSEKAEFFRAQTRQYWARFILRQEQAAKAKEVPDIDLNQA